MKKISILVPCYNEQDNVMPMGTALTQLMQEKLPGYDYEIIFIDNDSTDGTRALLRQMCAKDKKIKAIFNARNFGQFNSPYYGLYQTEGDCTVMLCCDFQDPVDLIPSFVQKWEEGAKIVAGIKTESDENHLVRFLRTCYYKIIHRMSDVEQIEHFTGFGLYDKSFIKVLKDLKDPTPFLRGIVAELGFRRVNVPYRQARRRAGKTHNNWYSLFDAAMLSFTSYTKVGLRFATIGGTLISIVSVGVAIFYTIYKFLHWKTFNAGMAPLIIGVFLFSGIQTFFIGFLGEYIMAINNRIMNRPLVIEEERINFD
ncbi:MAG: glycosyltransferase [Treponema sp.]|nr:glycosyltransferase [Treponema sp.]MCR5621798.1 glycosyltransferase [Treponema sp.]